MLSLALFSILTIRMADYSSRIAEFRLLDAQGVQLAYRQTDFKTISVSRQQGLFDLRNYLQHDVEPGREVISVAEIGVCIAEMVKVFNLHGHSFFRHCVGGGSRRRPSPR